MRFDSLNISNFASSAIKPLAMAAVATVAIAGMSSAQAKTLFKDTSITALYGGGFKNVPNKDETASLATMTIEHASTHDWGGIFMFVDRHQGEKDSSGKPYKETFGKVSPKFKVATFDDSFIKQVNLAGVYEFSSTTTGFAQDNYWIGIGADLNLPVPGMKYASATLYHSFNNAKLGNGKKSKGDDQKITLTSAWEKDNFLIDGYVDFAFNNEFDNVKNSIHLNPQIKYNIQPMLGIDNRLEVGIEYDYWKNKIGLDGVDQNAVAALVKYHF